MLIIEQQPIFERALRINLDNYHRMGSYGLISEKTELLRGVIIEKMSKSALHVKIVQALYRFFMENLKNIEIRQEQPITIASINSEPEPDILVVEANPQEFYDRHPTTARLVIEVSVSTLAIDRLKAYDYATAQIADYYLINAEQNEIEHFFNLQGKNYLSLEKFSFEQKINIEIAGKSLSFSLKELLL